MGIDSGVTVSVRRKRFAGRNFYDVLEKVNLEISPGEIVCIFGPSGCGKSTLLRILAGVDTEFEGNVELGNLGSGIQIGWLAQEDSLLPWRRVSGNVHFSRDLAGLPRSESCVDQMLKQVGLEANKYDWPHSLSGGMRRRVALARTLALQPTLIVLDEPFSGLDFVWRERLTKLLRETVSQRHVMAAIATHSLSDAASLATKLVVLGGRPASIRGIAVIDDDGPGDIVRNRVSRMHAPDWVRARFGAIP